MRVTQFNPKHALSLFKDLKKTKGTEITLIFCLFAFIFIDKSLSESPQWKKNQSLLLESPAHTALLTMRRMGSIA